jgi:hypothetical protein
VPVQARGWRKASRGGDTSYNLADETGALTDAYDYDAFGELTASSGTTENPYLFTEIYDVYLGRHLQGLLVRPCVRYSFRASPS